jgi:hypothetical protein
VKYSAVLIHTGTLGVKVCIKSLASEA